MCIQRYTTPLIIVTHHSPVNLLLLAHISGVQNLTVADAV